MQSYFKEKWFITFAGNPNLDLGIKHLIGKLMSWWAHCLHFVKPSIFRTTYDSCVWRYGTCIWCISSQRIAWNGFFLRISTLLSRIDRRVLSGYTLFAQSTVSKDVLSREPSPNYAHELIRMDRNLAGTMPDSKKIYSEVRIWMSHPSSKSNLCNHVAM